MKYFCSPFRSSENCRLACWMIFIYLGIGGLWIFFAELLPDFLVGSERHPKQLHLFFHVLFLLATTGLLWMMIRFFLRQVARKEDQLDDLVQGVVAVHGEEFFSCLVLNLARILDADYAFICLLSQDGRSAQTVSACADGKVVENFSFPLSDTPCELVVQGGACFYPERVREEFPLDPLACELEVESYLGVPLFDSTGRVLGPMAVFSRSPLRPKILAQSVLQLFAVRAAAELERMKAAETIEYMSSYDPLTDLPNRRRFGEVLSQALNQARLREEMVAVMVLDLNRFRTINDTLGHSVGDQILREVAGRLLVCLRHHDTVARLGGDQFLVVCPGIQHLEDAGRIAEKLLNRLRPSFQVMGHELHVDLSMGIALYPFDGEDGDALLKNADTALNRIKDFGLSSYQFYTPDMNAKFLSRLGMENQLRKALERQELVLYYQPQRDLAADRIVGVEALVRWRHPERELVLPGEFIPLAEETGLISAIDEWVLRTACAQSKAWQKAGLSPVRMSVNLSGRQFHQGDLVGKIERVLRDADLEAAWIELEVTEGLIMEDVEVTIARLRRLRELGVSIAIDDFGTGYSSLSYLKRFPLQALKIDRSFVQDIDRNSDDAAIVRAIIGLARNLKLEVVAEGVETEAQLAFLRAHHCDRIQGFLSGPPLPAEEMEKLLCREETPPLVAAEKEEEYVRRGPAC